jgi:hypothetical protein
MLFHKAQNTSTASDYEPTLACYTYRHSYRVSINPARQSAALRICYRYLDSLNCNPTLQHILQYFPLYILRVFFLISLFSSFIPFSLFIHAIPRCVRVFQDFLPVLSKNSRCDQPNLLFRTNLCQQAFCILHRQCQPVYTDSFPWVFFVRELRYRYLKPRRPKLKLNLFHYKPRMRLWGEEILDLGYRWGWVVSVTTRPRFSPGEGTPGIPCGGWVGLRAVLDTEVTIKVLLLQPGIEPRLPGCPACSQTLYWQLPGSYLKTKVQEIFWKQEEDTWKASYRLYY